MKTYRIYAHVLTQDSTALSDKLAELWEGHNLPGSWTVQKAGEGDYLVTFERTVEEDYEDILRAKLRFSEAVVGMGYRFCAVRHLMVQLCLDGVWQLPKLLARGEWLMGLDDAEFDTLIATHQKEVKNG